jgi:hypothetical protein
MNDEVTIKRAPALHEVCILFRGAKRGMFIPFEVVEWLQDNDVAWSIRGDPGSTTFTIPDETDRMLFKIKFAHHRI